MIATSFRALLETVHARQKFLACVETGRIDYGRRRQIWDDEIGSARVGVDDKRGGGRAEISRACAGVHLGQADVRRHGAARSESTSDDGAGGRPLVIRAGRGGKDGGGE